MNYQKDFQLFAKDHKVSSLLLDQYGKQLEKSDVVRNSYINPYIIEERQMNITQLDIFSRMMMERMIWIGSEINDQVSNIISSQLLYLDSIEKKDITIQIQSGGGSIYSGYSIYDTIGYISSDCNTIVMGLAASMALILTLAGKKRSALPHSRCMLHQPLSGVQGQATEIINTAKQVELLRTELYQIISEKTGQPYEKVALDGERDYWMTASEAKTYGIIHEIVTKRNN
jgi:ATP-dependent Clp protease protease subunit